jgi:hypothetical protein
LEKHKKKKATWYQRRPEKEDFPQIFGSVLEK